MGNQFFQFHQMNMAVLINLILIKNACKLIALIDAKSMTFKNNKKHVPHFSFEIENCCCYDSFTVSNMGSPAK